MKKLTIGLLAIAMIITFAQCSNSSPDILCSNADSRSKIISTLMNNEVYMKEVMDSMQANHGDGMMNSMMSMCASDSSMCKSMMGKTMEMCDMDKGKCDMMMGSMKEHPKTMQSMKDMGMCDMGGMKMDDHSQHH